MGKTYILDIDDDGYWQMDSVVDGERKFACSNKKIEDVEAVKTMISLDFDVEALKNLFRKKKEDHIYEFSTIL